VPARPQVTVFFSGCVPFIYAELVFKQFQPFTLFTNYVTAAMLTL
jgi:hypothetical protein